MILKAAKYPLKLIRRQLNSWETQKYVVNQLHKRNNDIDYFKYDFFKNEVLDFISGMKTDNTGIQFRYSASCNQPTLYSSAYACMIYSLFDELENLNEERKKKWIEYFDSFQREDGLFYDPVVVNEHFDADWWGARHLALHMISAYTDLNARPKMPFRFLQIYYDLDFLNKWLEENRVAFLSEMENDFDNKLMNIGCLLQYQRDFWNDAEAGKSLRFILQYLRRNLNSKTGLWGDDNIATPSLRSRKVQFAYHLLPLFFL